MMAYFDFFLTFTDKNSCFQINIDQILVQTPAHLGTQQGTQTLTLFFQDLPYMHYNWMAISSKINFIFEVSDSCLIMIENLILKRTNIKDGTGVSGW